MAGYTLKTGPVDTTDVTPAVVPASCSQARFWTLVHLESGNASGNAWRCWSIEGPLEMAVLQKSFAALIERHELLRTRFLMLDVELVQELVRPARSLSDLRPTSSLGKTAPGKNSKMSSKNRRNVVLAC